MINFSIFKLLRELTGYGNLHSEEEYDNMFRNGEKPGALPGFPQTGLLHGSFGGLQNVLQALAARLIGNELTGAEREANAFSASEAQKSRDFTEYMTRNKYQMETESMEQAGINPAMVYGGGQLVPTAANGAQASSVAPSEGKLFDMLSVFARLPEEIKVLRSEAFKNTAEGAAATQNANTNAQNANTASRQAAVAEARVQIERELANSQISWNDEDKKRVANQAAYLLEMKEYISKNYEVAAKNADSQQKQALAALKQADASVQNAATNDRLADYQSSLMYAQEMVAYADGEGKEIVNRYLDDKSKQELDNLRKLGLKLDSEKRLIDKQGNLATAEMVRTYINCGTDVANCISRYVGIGALSNAAANKPAPISPDMLYGNLGTYYE